MFIRTTFFALCTFIIPISSMQQSNPPIKEIYLSSTIPPTFENIDAYLRARKEAEKHRYDLPQRKNLPALHIPSHCLGQAKDK